MWYVLLLWRDDGQLRPTMRTSRHDTPADVIDAASRWLRLSNRGSVPSNLRYNRWTVIAAQAVDALPAGATSHVDGRIEYWN